MEPTVRPGAGGVGGVGDLAGQVSAVASRRQTPPTAPHVDRPDAAGKNPSLPATKLPAGPSAQAAVKATGAAVAAISVTGAKGAKGGSLVEQLQARREEVRGEKEALKSTLAGLGLSRPQMKLAELQLEHQTKQNAFVTAQGSPQNTKNLKATEQELIDVESKIRALTDKTEKHKSQQAAVGLISKINGLDRQIQDLGVQINKLSISDAPTDAQAEAQKTGGSSPKAAVEKQSVFGAIGAIGAKIQGAFTSPTAASRALANADKIAIPSFNLASVDKDLKFSSPKEALAALRAAGTEGADKPKAALNSYLKGLGFREDPIPREYSTTPIASDKIADAKYNKAIIDGLLDPKAKRFEKALNQWTAEAWNKLDILIAKAEESLENTEQTPDAIELRKELDNLKKARDADHGIDTGDTKGSKLDITPKGLIMGRLRRMENMYNTAFEISGLSK